MIKILPNLLSVGLLTATSPAMSKEETASVMSMKAALEQEPANPAFLSELGLTFIKDKKFQQAIPPLEQSLKIRGDDFKTHFYLALAYGSVGRLSEKLKELQETLRLKPDFSEANFKIGLAHAALNRHHEASKYYRKSIRQEPNNYDSHYFLALSCFLSNHYQEALSANKEFIRIKLNNAEAHYTLGQIYMKLESYMNINT
jgi:tetratricopeptide (TPR) repeat protein